MQMHTDTAQSAPPRPPSPAMPATGAAPDSESGPPVHAHALGARRPCAAGASASAASRSSSDAPGGLALDHLDQHLDLDLKLESLTLEEENLHWHQASSSQSHSHSHSSYTAYTHHQQTRQSLLSQQYSEHAQSVLTFHPAEPGGPSHPGSSAHHPYQSHARSQSHAELPLNPISIQPSLPPSLTTTPDSPIARSVPLPSVEDVFTSRPCSPWRTQFSDIPCADTAGVPCNTQQPTAGHEHCCEPVYRNRLLDMVRDEFGDLAAAAEVDDGASVASASTHGLDLDGMSRGVSRSNTVRSVRSGRSAVSRASTSRGISPQPTIVLSLEGSDGEMLHEGCDSTEDTTGATGAQRSFRPLASTIANGDADHERQASDGSSQSTEGGSEEVNLEASEAPLGTLDAPEVKEGSEEACHQCEPAHYEPHVLSVTELRDFPLPASWPRVSLVSPEKVIIDRRVVSGGAVLPSDASAGGFGGMVPLDVPEFQLDATPGLSSSAGSMLGSSAGSSLSGCSRISRNSKGSNETTFTSATAASGASQPHVCPAPAAQELLFGRDFASRLMLNLYRANLLKSPIGSPLNSPSTSPSTGTATAWWGGGLSVRSAAREVLRDDGEVELGEPVHINGFSAPGVPDVNAVPYGGMSGGLGLGMAAEADDHGQEVTLPDPEDSSDCSTPIAANAPHAHRPVVTSAGFKLEGKSFEFDPPFSASESEALSRELNEVITKEGVEHPAYSSYASSQSHSHSSHSHSHSYSLSHSYTYSAHYPAHYGSPNGHSDANGHGHGHGHEYSAEMLARLADPRASSLGPLAPELATTRPSTPPDTPTVGCAPLPTMTVPATPMQTRPSSPTVLQKAVAINAALQQLARNSSGSASGSPSLHSESRPAPLSPLSLGSGISVTNERPSRLEEMRRQSLRAAGIVSPSSSASPAASNPGARRKSLEWAKMTPRSSGEYARDIFGGLLRDSGPNASVSQPSSPEFLKRKLAGEWDLSTTESAPGSPKSSRRNTLSGLGLFLSRARTKQK